MKLPANQGKLICRRNDDDLEPLLFFNRTDGKAKLTHLITCDWLELPSWTEACKNENVRSTYYEYEEFCTAKLKRKQLFLSYYVFNSSTFFLVLELIAFPFKQEKSLEPHGAFCIPYHWNKDGCVLSIKNILFCKIGVIVTFQTIPFCIGKSSSTSKE